MTPVPIPPGVPCRCLPRNATCVILYVLVLISILLLVFGIVGIALDLNGDSERCPPYGGFISAVFSFWTGAATANLDKFYGQWARTNTKEEEDE